MFNKKSKQTLDELRASLSRWSQEVPARADRFHALCTDLLRQVEEAGGAWTGPGETELASLRQQVGRLGELVPDLIHLFQRAEVLEREILALRGRIGNGQEPQLASWMNDRCIDWQSALRRLGAHVDRRPELDQDFSTLERTEIRVRRHDEALHWLIEARRILDRLGGRLEAATLRADLPGLQQQLFTGGATPEWIADLTARVQQLQPLVDPPPKAPPRKLNQVPQLLAEGRRWSRALAHGEERGIGLEQEYQSVMSDWEDRADDEIEALLAAAGRWLDDLRRDAASRRAAALALLEEQRLHLAAACGPEPAIEREIESLKAEAADEPDTYEDWLEQHRRIEQRLTDFAGAQSLHLGDWIARSAAGLRQSLTALSQGPLPERAAREVERITLELQRIPGLRDLDRPEEIFNGLRTCARLAADIDRLQRQTQADRAAFEEVRRRLVARNRALQEQAAGVAMDLPGIAELGKKIEAFSASQGASLDDLQSRAAELYGEAGFLERELVALCKVWITEQAHALVSRIEVLDRMGKTPSGLPQTPPPDASPEQVIRAVIELRAVQGETAKLLEEAQAELETRRDEVLAQLREIPRDSLRPEVRQAATDLEHRLEDSRNGAHEPFAALCELLGTLERSGSFLARLSEEDRRARERSESLRVRLRELSSKGLDSFCPPELVHRASALIFGVPAEPRRWGEILGQLDAADELLGRLEIHARRLAAARGGEV